MKYNTPLQNNYNPGYNAIGAGQSSIETYKKISIPVAFANIALIYILSSIYYLFMTSFSEENDEISKKKRKHFYLGVILSTISILYFKPFKSYL